MSKHEEEPSTNPTNRWYDTDPALKGALEQLRAASTHHQAQIALNIIKIIVEHQMENETNLKVEDLNNALPSPSSSEDHRRHRRWYDVHEALNSAIQLLLDCPPDLQQRLIPSIIQVIENTLDAPTS